MLVLLLKTSFRNVVPKLRCFWFQSYFLCCRFSIMSPFQDWDNASALARAFSMGAKESAAVSNLQCRTDKSILARFKQVTDRRGLRAFITHDALARGILNLGFSSSQGHTEAWDAVLTTSDDNRLATQIK